MPDFQKSSFLNQIKVELAGSNPASHWARVKHITLQDILSISNKNDTFISVSQLQDLLRGDKSFIDVSSDKKTFSPTSTIIHGSEFASQNMVFDTVQLSPSQSEGEMSSEDQLLQVRDKTNKRGTSSETDLMFAQIVKHVPEWRFVLQSPDDLDFKRLNGNSNACYKVSIKDGLYPEMIKTRALLFRRYE